MGMVEDLKAARALIDTPERWAKGPGVWGDNQRCAEQSLHFMGIGPPDAVSRALPFWWKVRQWFRGRWSILSSANIIRFNDAPGTTHADIMALFARAIHQAEAHNNE